MGADLPLTIAPPRDFRGRANRRVAYVTSGSQKAVQPPLELPCVKSCAPIGASSKVAADPKAPFLNQKSPSQRAKEEGAFCDPHHGSADSVVVAYCVEAWGGHDPWLRWRVETKGMPATLVAIGQ